MNRLPLPTIEFRTALEAAFQGIADENRRGLHFSAFADFAQLEEAYCDNAVAGSLHAMSRVASGPADPVVLGGLHKSDLTALYSKYFVPANKPARRLYEELKVTANGKCPLCGGVGHVRTLDHYLPKANFPLYSVLPKNLVPCCRDCNTEKLNSFALTADEQTLHPYFDADRYFTERWVDAIVIVGKIPVIEFFAAPPSNWSDIEVSRAKAHFDAYGLAAKFSVEAGADLPETIQTRVTTMAASTPEAFSSYLSEKSETLALPVNHWRRVMFAALARDVWFCSQTFIQT